jgi:hypothetical protein
MVHSFFNAVITFFFIAITRDKDAFFNYPAKIETLSVVFLILMFNPARIVDRFFVVFSIFAKSLS